MIFEIKLALQYLLGRKLRTTLTTLSIIFGVMVIFSLNGVIPTLQESFKRSIMVSADKVDFTVTSITQGNFADDNLEKVSAISGVKSVSGLLTKNILLPPSLALTTADGQQIKSLTLTGIDPDSFVQQRKLDMASGSMLASGDDWKVLLPENLSEKTGKKVGDTLTLPSVNGVKVFTIAGIYKSKAAVTEEVYVPLKNAQELLGLLDEINVIEVMFSANANPDELSKTILDQLGAGFKQGGNEAGTELMAAIKMGQNVFLAFGLIALSIGAFIIFITFRTIAVERRRDIGLLRAVGATRRKVVEMMLWEGILQGIAGTAIGLLAGFALIRVMLFKIQSAMQDIVPMQIDSVKFPLSAYILAIALGIGVTVVGGFIPAISASRVSPLDALRPSRYLSKKGEFKGRIISGIALFALSAVGLTLGSLGMVSLAFFLFIAGLIVIGPALIKPIAAVYSGLISLIYPKEGPVAKGNLENHPRRSATTAVTLMIGLSLLISLAGVVTSMTAAMYSYIDKSLGSDYILSPQSMLLSGGNVGAGQELVQRIREIPGISGATGLRLSLAKLNGTDVQVIGIDPETYPKIAGLEFSSGDEDMAYESLKSGRNVIINGILASSQRIKTGDVLKLYTPEGVRDYTVVGIGMDFLNVKIATVYMSQQNLKNDFREVNDIFILADKDKGADGATVKKALQKAIEPYPSFTLYSSEEYMSAMKKDISASMSFLNILLAAAVIPSLFALVNTLGIAVLERTREIGVMRAIGTTRKQVKRIIMAESLLLSGIGLLFSIVAGIWLGYILVKALNVSGFKVDYYFPYTGIALAAAVGLIFGLIGALIPARHAAKLKIVKALQYE